MKPPKKLDNKGRQYICRVIDLEVLERALTALKGEEPDRVPVVLQVYGLVLKRFGGVPEYDYYRDVKLQLESKIAFQHRFPEVLNVSMGTLPEYAELHTVPAAFGGKIGWMKDSPPFVEEYPIKTPEDVDRLVEAGTPDPREAGVAPEILKRLEYFYEWFPKDLRERYGYVDGNLWPGACVEGAALGMGYDKFLIWMRLHPSTLHKWLRLATDWYLEFCEAIEEKVGPCRVLWIGDHSASMVGKGQFREFILPYLNKVFKKYRGALRIWHNEGSVGHMLEEVDQIDAEVWHSGPFDDIALCKERTHFCIQGNIHPPWFAKYKPEKVEEECRKIITAASRGGRLWLSTGGGMAPGTPLRNIDAMLKAVEKYGVYRR